MDEVAVELGDFPTFNDFFTRRLAPGARPVDHRPDLMVSPCDGLIVSVEEIGAQGTMGQIKGARYTVASLLDDPQAAASYVGGHQVTIYLSPRHYHRVHSPTRAKVRRVRHIPGRCYPVNAWAASRLDGLYAQNERVIFELAGGLGASLALVMVGAANVARISVAFHELRSNAGTKGQTVDIDGISLERGDELGRFNLGSTVVLLLPAELGFAPTCQVGNEVRMGEGLGRCAALG
jgi:phosphatidylserine decarboxylase